MDIQEILKNYKIGRDTNAPKSERAELVGKFVDRLNKSRIENNYKPLPARFYAVKLAQSGLKTNGDLYWFFAYCDETKNFDKTFWWSLKSK